MTSIEETILDMIPIPTAINFEFRLTASEEEFVKQTRLFSSSS